MVKQTIAGSVKHFNLSSKALNSEMKRKKINYFQIEANYRLIWAIAIKILVIPLNKITLNDERVRC